MFVFHPTIRLAQKMKIQTTTTRENSHSTLLGNWYAEVLILSTKQFIICMNDKSNLTVVLNASPYSTCASRLKIGLQEILLDLGVPSNIVDSECIEMDTFQFAKSSNKIASGKLNQRRFEMETAFYFEQKKHLSPFEMSRRTNKVISISLPEGFPDEATVRILRLGYPEYPRI
jgi:hypothetical protein